MVSEARRAALLRDQPTRRQVASAKKPTRATTLCRQHVDQPQSRLLDSPKTTDSAARHTKIVDILAASRFHSRIRACRQHPHAGGSAADDRHRERADTDADDLGPLVAV